LVIDGTVTELHVFVKKAADVRGNQINGRVKPIPESAFEGDEVGIIDFFVGRKPDRWIGVAQFPPSVARSIAEQWGAIQEHVAEVQS